MKDLLVVRFLDNAYLPFRMRLFAQTTLLTLCTIFMVAHAVTSLGNNLHDSVNIGDSSSISLDLKTFYFLWKSVLHSYVSYSQLTKNFSL